jgi:hypothetical protein
MSRCVLDNEDTGTEVFIGWDPGLNTFFAQVVESGHDEPSVWHGTAPDELTNEKKLMAVIREIKPHACKFDEAELLRSLLEDQRTDSERTYGL